ncbi:MAG: hypothetical protein WA979_02815 [Pacificimonas sp.]
MRITFITLLAATAGGLVAAPATAQVDNARIVKCAAVVDQTERLSCYDNIARSVSVEGQRIVNSRAAEEARQAQERAAGDAVKAAEAARVAAATEAERKRDAEMALGAEQVLAGGGRAARDVEEASYILAEVQTSSVGQTSFRFTNGMIWAQTVGRTLRLREGDAVSISRAPLSGYKISKAGGGRSVRVKRLR